MPRREMFGDIRNNLFVQTGAELLELFGNYISDKCTCGRSPFNPDDGKQPKTFGLNILIFLTF